LTKGETSWKYPFVRMRHISEVQAPLGIKETENSHSQSQFHINCKWKNVSYVPYVNELI